jgi:carboxyl-terminal processing protease
VKRFIKDSPASKSDLKLGDIILKVDDFSISDNEDISVVVGKIRGKASTEVKINVTDSTPSKSRDVKIIRAGIRSESMELMDEGDGIYRVKLYRFTEETLSEFNSNWDKLEKDLLSKNPKGVVLDLRGNPGGYLQGAFHIAQSFLKKDQIVLYVRDRDGISETYKVEESGRLSEIPMIVLVDSGSASASEILAGALSKNGRSKLIGSNTFGKGSAQTILEPNGWNGASLHLTVQKWLLPDKSELTREKPLLPDTVLEADFEDIKKGNDAQKQKAIELLKMLIK